MRTLSTACMRPGHLKCDDIGFRFLGIKVQGTSCEPMAGNSMQAASNALASLHCHTISEVHTSSRKHNDGM